MHSMTPSCTSGSRASMAAAVQARSCTPQHLLPGRAMGEVGRSPRRSPNCLGRWQKAPQTLGTQAFSWSQASAGALREPPLFQAPTVSSSPFRCVSQACCLRWDRSFLGKAWVHCPVPRDGSKPRVSGGLYFPWPHWVRTRPVNQTSPFPWTSKNSNTKPESRQGVLLAGYKQGN